jgi:DNA polymerase III alpha subunit
LIRLQDVVTAYAGALSEEGNGQQVTVAGMVQRVRRHVTKKGDEMAFVTLEDLQGTCDVVVFPRVWSNTKNLWHPERILVINGKVDARRRDTPSLLCNWVKTPDEVSTPVGQGERRAQTAGPSTPPPPPPRHALGSTTRLRPSPLVHTVCVTLIRSGEQARDMQKLRSLHSLLVEYPGQDRFTIRLVGGSSKPVELAFPNDTTHYSPELEQRLATIVGSEGVRVEAVT